MRFAPRGPADPSLALNFGTPGEMTRSDTAGCGYHGQPAIIEPMRCIHDLDREASACGRNLSSPCPPD
jgi:hypothetical protein